jgi:N6-L-threonylcarbamoyladenine synthase
MKILAIETSCDETAVCIMDDKKNIFSHQLFSQIKIHQQYGGVVPEVAARSHLEIIDKLILQAVAEAKINLSEIDAFAATAGPGLIGGVIVGLTAAKTLSAIYDKPLIAVNHLEGHALSVRLSHQVEFPYLMMLISGGHCQILIALGVGNYLKIGETIDDSLGETFDKVAQMINFDYPGGPKIEKNALNGDELAFNFPRPLINDKNNLTNFSFSGLKTAVRREIEKIANEQYSQSIGEKISTKDKENICASFQRTVSEILINRLQNCLECESFKKIDQQIKIKSVVIAGGVAANKYIFKKIDVWAKNNNLDLIAPPINLCTDNAAMIAWAAIERIKLGLIDDLYFRPRARWDLSES